MKLTTLEAAVIFRSIGQADLPRAAGLIAPEPASTLTPGQFMDRFTRREYRPEWTWIAEETRAGPPLAVAVWWGAPGEALPDALDGVFVRDTAGPAADRSRLAAALLTAAHTSFAGAGKAKPPDFHIFLPGDWRDRPDVSASLAWREQAARSVGLTTSLERLRYEWGPPAALPARSTGDTTTWTRYSRASPGTWPSTPGPGPSAPIPTW